MGLKVYTDRGIPSDRISPGAFGEEIERQAIQTLQKAGITLVKETEADAILNLNVYLVCESEGSSCGYNTRLELEQWAQMSRDANIVVAATTWSNSYSKAISKNQIYCCLPDLIDADARSLLAGFMQDFQKANRP